MSRFGAQLFGLVTVLLPLGLLVAAPVAAFVAAGRRPWWQVLAATLGGYLLLALLVGAYAYAVVPADYTRRHAWTRHPVASSLGDQHGHVLGVAEARAARAPDELAARASRSGGSAGSTWPTGCGLRSPACPCRSSSRSGGAGGAGERGARPHPCCPRSLR